MEVTVGAILEGKVTGITKFGAFVALPGGRSGLVHISNISSEYVSDVNDVLTVGQEVKVKVLNIDQNDRINLSIKHTQSRPHSGTVHSGGTARSGDRDHRPGGQDHRAGGGRPRSGSTGNYRAAGPKEPETFEDKLKQYMAESESKLSKLSRYNDRGRSRRRRG